MAVALYGWQGHIKDHHLAELRLVIQRKYESMSATDRRHAGLVGEEESLEVLLTDLKKVVKRGLRLEQSCSTFGTGPLFWMHGLFNDNL